ncbi:chlorohydrolase [Streptococcus pneumoniae]|nr:chlorohydrolase [Streptococcus pneumoniae]
MKIKDQTRKLATGCSKQDKTNEYSSKHSFEVADDDDVV